MNVAIKILYFFVDLILPLTVGYLLASKRKGTQEKFDQMLYLNIWIIYPIMNLLSTWIVTLNIEMIWLPILGIVMQIIPGLVGICGSQRHKNASDKGSYIVSSILSNRGVAGSLAVFILFGEQGYAYARFIMLLSSFTIYMFCFPLAQYFYQKQKGQDRKKISFKEILFNKNQFPLIGLLLGALLNVSGIKRPNIFGDAFQVIIHINAWMSLIPLGYTLNFKEMKNYNRDVLEISAIKFIITPILTFFIAKLLISDPIMIATTTIIAASPSAINAVVTAKVNKINVQLAMATFIGTMFIFLLAVFPVVLYICNHFLI